jgi:hypothetical protein
MSVKRIFAGSSVLIQSLRNSFAGVSRLFTVALDRCPTPAV